MDKITLEGKEAYYLIDTIPETLSSKCPRCQEERYIKDLISEDGVQCFKCGRIATITIIEDTGFITWTCGLDKGRIKISEMPELPSELRDRLQKEYQISEEEAYKLSTVREKAKFFEELTEDIDPAIASTFVVDLLTRELKYRDMKLSEFKSSGVKELITDYDNDKITEDSVDEVIRKSLDNDKKVSSVYSKEEHLKEDKEELKQICQEVIQEESQAVEEYKQGDEDVINYLIGMVKKKTGGRADAKKSREIIKSKI